MAEDELEQALRDPEKVEALTLRDLKSLPESAGRLVNLKRLTVRGMTFERFPDAFWTLKRLEHLDMSAIGPGGIPPEIGELESLRSLTVVDFDGRKVSDLPASITRLEKLRELSLHRTALGEFPLVLCELAALEELSVSGGTLGAVPQQIERLQNLHDLTLREAGVRSLPLQLGSLRELTSLTVTSSPLATLPSSASQLSRLTMLDLSDCAIAEFPRAISHLTNLSSLMLANNPNLKEIPEGAFARLIELVHVNLRNCGLKDLPREVSSLPRLRRLILSENVFSDEAFVALQQVDSKKLTIGMPRRATLTVTPKQVSDVPLATAVRAELVRLGATVRLTAKHPKDMIVGGRSWGVHRALGELLWGYDYPQTILKGKLAERDASLTLKPHSVSLDEYEIIHHHPHVVLGYTTTNDLLLVSLTDADPSDPQVYYLDHEEYGAIEAQLIGRMSAFLRALSPTSSS